MGYSELLMSQTFVVEVTQKPDITPQEAVENLAKAFNIAPRKIELMLKRLPGVATKPISEQEATVVVTYFEQAGLKALKKPVTLPTPISSETKTTPTTTEPAMNTSASGELPSPKTSSEIAKERLEQVYKAEEASTARDTSKPTSKERTNDSLPAPNAQVPMVRAEPPADLLKALGEVASPPQVQPRPSNASSPSSAAVLSPPKPEKRTEHDILRTTLIGEPDPRQTLQDIYDSSAALPVLAKQRRSGSLANTLLFTAIVPILLTLLGTLIASYFMLQGALRDGAQSSVRHPSVALAASLSSVLIETATGEVNYTQLQESIEVTRRAFETLPISFIAVTDSEGEVLPASWFESSTFLEGQNVREAIRERALRAVSGSDTTSVPVSAASGLEVASQPLILNDQVVGAIVVGAAGGDALSDLWQLLGRIALLSLIPLALASLLAILLTRPILRRIHYLTERAEDMSKGHLSGSVAVKGGDELSSLAEALERLRVTMQGAVERLRRRR
jgi:HAMP domain-containing protein